MRRPLIVLLSVLAAVAAVLLALRGGGEPQDVMQRAPTAPVPASATAPASASASRPEPQADSPQSAAQWPGPTPTAPADGAPAPKPALTPARPPAQSTFALSSDHQSLIHGTQLAAADHDRLEREPRDDAWAADTERLIRQELARHGSAVDFDVIAVDCRQTLCAIQAFSNGENGHRQWVRAVDELYRDSLAGAFDSVNTAFPAKSSSRAPVLTFLHRKPAGTKP